MKEIKKEESVRNEFLYGGNSAGKYNFPIIRKQDIDIDKIELLSYVDSKINDDEHKEKTIHFFTYDWKFEKVYTNAKQELEKLNQYYCLISPDFSIFTNMPLALQIASVFKNRWCGAYWQSVGLKVIPAVSWGDERSFDFCFDGIEEGSVVMVCTYYRENDELSFMRGYNEMLKRIKPKMVLCYDEPFDGMGKNVKSFLPTTYEWVENLPKDERARFCVEKHVRNLSGLDPAGFKYVKYDDPYAKEYLLKCPVCGNICFVDRFGNGKCDNCLWNLDESCEALPDEVQYPNVVSLNKAKRLYELGEDLKPSLDDFLAGLKMYSEMAFLYNGKSASVYLSDGRVVFEYNGDVYEFESVEDFKEKAVVNGCLLKDVWQDVEKADYMQG